MQPLPLNPNLKMERDFASSFGSNSNTHYPPSFTTDYSIFNDPNLQPFLSLPSDPSIFNFFGQPQDFPSLPLESPSPLPPQILPDSTHFLDLFSKPLPDLHSLEQPPLRRLPRLTDSSSSSSSARKLKRTRLDLNLSDDNDPQTLNSIVQSFNSPPPRIPPHSEIARTRRQKLSEKIRCLQKLLPWDKKMDTCTLLEEASKYIRFLQAQVSTLLSMPITSSFGSSEHNAPLGFGYGGLARLNRQQFLQVLINSPAVQTVLSSQGSCVFAYEQLVSLKKAKERKTVLQQFLLG